MTIKLICCASLPPATISSVPIADLAFANDELAEKGICNHIIIHVVEKAFVKGAFTPSTKSGNIDKVSILQCRSQHIDWKKS
jgi:hypothetical protein